MKRSHRIATTLLFGVAMAAPRVAAQEPVFRLNDREYFAMEGVNVMAFQDIYPDGHQGGVSVIEQGVRVASNGDLRLEPTPGQWSPMPQQDRRVVDRAAREIVTWLSYPDTSKDRHGFNPIVYPDLKLSYQVRVRADGDAVRVTVDLDRPLPSEWVGQVGFNLELYPTSYFGKSWYLGGDSGIFPRQPNGPVRLDASGEPQAVPLAAGPRLSIAPDADSLRMTIESRTGDLLLLDGRNRHNNGWFIVRSLARPGVTKGAVEWIIRPHAVPGWRYEPVVQVSQVGYHPAQKKRAVIELDSRDTMVATVALQRVREDGGVEEVLRKRPEEFGDFLRYRYLRFDFTDVTRPGMYRIEYGGVRSNPFQISPTVFSHDVWQPTLQTFLPVQMCHMRVEEQYRVWHGLDHMDDAVMAPPDSNHFDGYVQGPSTLTRFSGGDHVPGLNVGGWHDAGDYDLRIESQADEVFILASSYELFDEEYDQTTIDQGRRLVEIHRPDGKADLLQQVEHGILSILGGYRSLGRLYRGIQDANLKQYVLLGDASTSTDNLVHDPALAPGERTGTTSAVADDRMVFTEENPSHEYKGIAALAIAGRVLRAYGPELARESVDAAEALWREERDPERAFDDRIAAATELLLTTGKEEYRRALLDSRDQIIARIGSVGWSIGRALPLLRDPAFEAAVRDAVARDFAEVEAAQRKTPYGVPYEPYIWGAGWGIQSFGVHQYFLHRAFPEIVTPEYMLNALNFVLGVHPGRNTASFASGVGARSMTTAYGVNRADWSYIPGGVVSGTALIRPDFPEMKNFPYLWQQAEYVLGGGASNFMFLALAADDVLSDREIGQ